MRATRPAAVSVRWRPRHVLVNVVVAAAVLLLFAISIGVGDYPVSPGRVLQVLLTGDGSRIEQLVVLEWRMPRALVGVAAGGALALSGALMQSITRNPLASPDILGITSGAAAMAVTVITLGGASWLGMVGIPLAAIIGAFATAGVMWVLAWRRGLDSYRLVLVGIVLSALLQAYIHYRTIRADLHDAATAQLWLTGSLTASDWSRAIPLSALLLASIPLLAWVAFQLSATVLGDDIAHALGVRVSAAQAALLALTVVLAACAVAAAGPIGFVAFVAPQVALRLCGASAPPLLASTLVGAAVLLIADITTQAILPFELPVGILTSAFGGVFLMYLLFRQSRKV